MDITSPNGTKNTDGPFKSDSVGGSYAEYTFDTAGNYTLPLRFGPQVVTGSNGTGIYNYNVAINNILSSQQRNHVAHCTGRPIPNLPTYPLPTEYWSRPIEGQNHQWSQIASSWLRGSQDFWRNLQNDGIAPNTAHIMWSKPLEDGGVVGGNETMTEGMTFYDGSAYEGKGRNPLIVDQDSTTRYHEAAVHQVTDTCVLICELEKKYSGKTCLTDIRSTLRLRIDESTWSHS